MIKLLSTDDPNNKLGKVFSLVWESAINIPRNIDKQAPVILLDLTGVVGLGSVNYVFIEELERYYFITNFNDYGSFHELVLEVDVLESFKADILASNAQVMRGVTVGDYNRADFDYSEKLDVVKYEGVVSLNSLKNTLVISTMTGG